MHAVIIFLLIAVFGLMALYSSRTRDKLQAGGIALVGLLFYTPVGLILLIAVVAIAYWSYFITSAIAIMLYQDIAAHTAGYIMGAASLGVLCYVTSKLGDWIHGVHRR
jgi:hypothetical protein